MPHNPIGIIALIRNYAFLRTGIGTGTDFISFLRTDQIVKVPGGGREGGGGGGGQTNEK